MPRNIDDDLEDFIKGSIREWVGKNFGSQEVEEPSWNIDELAKCLAACIHKRERDTETMCDYNIMLYTIDTDDVKARQDIVLRVMRKIERIGGVFIMSEEKKKTFTDWERDQLELGRHQKGYKIKISVSIIQGIHRYSALIRWLGRLRSGTNEILDYSVVAQN